MRSGQVHKLEFESDVDGYVINFQLLFLTNYLLVIQLLINLFFNIFSSGQMLKLREIIRPKLVLIFE